MLPPRRAEALQRQRAEALRRQRVAGARAGQQQEQAEEAPRQGAAGAPAGQQQEQAEEAPRQGAAGAPAGQREQVEEALAARRHEAAHGSLQAEERYTGPTAATRPSIGAAIRGMCMRAAWIFTTDPVAAEPSSGSGRAA